MRKPIELRRLLLATDFSAASLGAFPWAERIARSHGAHILLANVQEPMGLPGTVEYARFHPEIDALREEADARLENWQKTHLAADLSVETRVLEGEPAPALCRLAETTGTDLIIMSAPSAKTWWHKWLGGTTERVLRTATCSVLVVPTPQRPAPRRRLAPTAPASTATWDTRWTAWLHHKSSPEL